MTSAQLLSALAELHWSQAELARRSGVTVQSVNAWATGKTPVPDWAPAFLSTLIDLRNAAITSGACKN